MRLISIFLSILFLSACSGGGGGGSSTTYKYQVSGVSPLSVSSTSDDDISALSSSFILKWNEDSNGNISGIYMNQSTGQSIQVTGVSDGTGRTIDGALNPPEGGVSSIRFIVSQTGDLNGTVNATFKTFDSGGSELSSQNISVDATTTGSSGGGGGGGGGTGTLNSYVGLYAGVMTELTNQAVAGGIGNGKYCDFSFAGSELKFELSNYLMLGYSTRYSQVNGAYVDVTGADPASLSVTMDKGFPSASLMDYGYQDTGVKITAADQSAGKRLTITFVGAFSGTTTKTLSGTLTAKLDTTAVCEFTVSMTKQ